MFCYGAMRPIFSTPARWVVGAPLAVAVAVVALSACLRVVDGTPMASDTGHRPTALADLLIAPDRFPARYPARVLDPPAVAHAIRVIDGVDGGAAVDPAHCAPRAPRDAVAILGVDADTSSSLTVAVTRVDGELAARRSQLEGCRSLRVGEGGAATTVTSVPLPAPPIDADDTIAVQQNVTRPDDTTTRSMTLIAQIARVRISATVAAPDGELDTEALHAMFTDAVLTARRSGLS